MAGGIIAECSGNIYQSGRVIGLFMLLLYDVSSFARVYGIVKVPTVRLGKTQDKFWQIKARTNHPK